jgi:hypothetical protein
MVVEPPPSKHEALSSNPIATKTKEKLLVNLLSVSGCTALSNHFCPKLQMGSTGSSFVRLLQHQVKERRGENTLLWPLIMARWHTAVSNPTKTLGWIIDNSAHSVASYYVTVIAGLLAKVCFD